MNTYTEPHLATSALVIVDAQRAFVSEGASGRDLKIKVVPTIRKLLDAYRESKRPVVHVVRIYIPDGSNVDICRRARVEERGTVLSPDGTSFYPVDELLPHGVKLDSHKLLYGEIQTIASNEVVIYKPRFNAFYGTCLREYLDSLKVDTLVITGFNYPNCPRATIYGASDRDFRLVIPEGAISHMEEEDRRQLEAIGICFFKPDKLQDMIREKEFLV